MRGRPIDILYAALERSKEAILKTPLRQIPGIGLVYIRLSNVISNRRYRNVDVPERITYRGRQIYVDPESDWAKEMYLGNGCPDYIKNDWAILSDYLSEGDLVLDIGAFVGTHTLMMRELIGESGEVYLFEPQPDCINLLEKTIYANRFDNCSIIPKLVGQEDGTQELMTTKSPDSTSNVTDRDPWNRGYDSVSVGMTRLDSFLHDNHIEEVDFIKVDVQGAELQVIKGLGTRLADVSTIYMEIHSKYIANVPEEVSDLFDTLHSKGDIIRVDANTPNVVENAEEIMFERKHPTIIWVSD